MHARSSWLWVLLASAVLPAVAEQQGDDGNWTPKSVMKAMDKATKGLKALTADVHYTESLGGRPLEGEGKFYLVSDGRARAEIGGRNPRTFLSLPPDLYVHRIPEKVLEIHFLPANPDMLAQYTLVGFVPTGTGLKKRFQMRIVGEEDVDGTPALHLILNPKDKEVLAVLSSVDLWVDLESWLPAKQIIYQRGGRTELTVRYRNLTPTAAHPDELFRPDWPEDVTVQRD